MEYTFENDVKRVAPFWCQTKISNVKCFSPEVEHVKTKTNKNQFKCITFGPLEVTFSLNFASESWLVLKIKYEAQA